MDFSGKNYILDRRRGSVAWVVLAAGLILSGLTWNAVRSQIDREIADHFRDAATDARNAIESRIHSYADVLVGVRALHLATAGGFSGEIFNKYVAGLDAGQRHPGVRAVLYAQHVTAAQRAAFEAAVRDAGEPAFVIKPPGQRDEYVVVRHVAPRAGNDAVLGLDLAADKVRFDELNRARESGQLVASGPLALVLDPDGPPGFAMRLPVYRVGAPTATPEQRRAAFTGAITASFIVIDVMRELFSEILLNQVHVRIHDAGRIGDGQAPEAPSAKNLMFDSNRLLASPVPVIVANSRAAGALTHESSIDVGGRRWNLYFAARPGFGSTVQRWVPWVVLGTGLAISLLLAGLARSLQISRWRAMESADRAITYLQKSELQLTEEQHRTRELLEAIPTPIFYKGTDGRYLGVNKAWEAFFGRQRGSFVGKTVHDLYPHQPEIADRLHALDQDLWRSESPQVYETTITNGQGKTREAVYYKATYTNRDGGIAGLIGTIIDITERKANEQRFRVLFDNAAVGIATVDLNGVVTDANQKFLDMLGYAKEELVGRRIAELAITHEGEAGSRAGAGVQNFSGASIIETRFARKGDGAIWVRRTISAICGPDGNPDYLVNIVEDITDRKKEELRREMEYSVTHALAEEKNLADLFPGIIATICRNMGWEFGMAWVWSGDDQGLKYCASWGADAPALRQFVADCMQRVIQPVPGEQGGLIRRAYASGEAVWISNIAQEQGFLRAQLIRNAGLRGAFAFPLLRGSEVVGVMEFYRRGAHESEKALIGTAQSIGRQIGQYMGRREAEEALKFVAAHDTLTKLPNRMMFNQQLTHALTQAQRGKQGLAVLFIDLDRFKAINDTLGHEAGDTLLCEVAARLKGELRASDIVARLGGDEFVVLIENVVDRAFIGNVTRKLVGTLTANFRLSGGEHNVSASIGISIYPDDGEDAQTLLKHADTAMYRAKNQGRNAFQFYSTPSSASAADT